MLYIVTVKLPKTPGHDGRNKIAGPCPAGPGPLSGLDRLHCTDTTGEHHSFLMDASGPSEIEFRMAERKIHVTRIEQAS